MLRAGKVSPRTDRWLLRNADFALNYLQFISPETMKVASISELYSLARAVKQNICDDDRADEFDEEPGLCLTVGVDLKGNYDYQLGCNQYHGSAYFYPHWLVANVYRSTNCRVLARDLREQWLALPE